MVVQLDEGILSGGENGQLLYGLYMLGIFILYAGYMLSLCQGYPDDMFALPTETKTNNLKKTKRDVKNK